MNPKETEYVLASLELLKTAIQTAQDPHQLFYRLREVHHAIFSSFYNFLKQLRGSRIVVNGLNGLQAILMTLQERNHGKRDPVAIMYELDDTLKSVYRAILHSNKELDKRMNPLTNAMMYYSKVDHLIGQDNVVEINLIDRFVDSPMYERNADNTFSPFSQHFLAFCKTFKHGVIDRTTELDQVDWTFVACKLNLVDNSDQLKELFKSFVLPLQIMELPLPTSDSHNYVDWVVFKARMIEPVLSKFFSGVTAQTLRRVDPPPQPSWFKRQRTSVVSIARWALGRQEHPPMQFAVTDETLNCFERYPGLLQRLVVQCATVDVKPIALDPKPILLSGKSMETLGAIDRLGKANSTTTRLECPICYKSFERTLKTKDGDLLDFTPGCRTPKCAGWQICKDCLHSALHTHNLSTCSQCRTDWGTRPISRVIKMEEGVPSFVGVDPSVDIPLLSKRLGKMDQSFNGIVGQNITHALSFVETCDEADKCPGLGFPQTILGKGRELRERLAVFQATDIAHALRKSQAELHQLINPRETDVTGPDTEQGPEQGDKRGRSSGGTRFKKQRHQKHKRTKKRNVH